MGLLHAGQQVLTRYKKKYNYTVTNTNTGPPKRFWNKSSLLFMKLCTAHHCWEKECSSSKNASSYGRRSLSKEFSLLFWDFIFISTCKGQGGITCGAIDEPRKSSKAIDERVIINFRDKNVAIAHFRDKNGVLSFLYMYVYIFIYVLFLSIAFLFYR